MAPVCKNCFKWNMFFKNDYTQYQVVLSRLLNNLCTCTIRPVLYLGISFLSMFSLLLSCSINAEPLRKRGKLRRNRYNFYLQREHTQHDLLFGIQANRSAFVILPSPQVEHYPHLFPGLISPVPQSTQTLFFSSYVDQLCISYSLHLPPRLQTHSLYNSLSNMRWLLRHLQLPPLSKNRFPQIRVCISFLDMACILLH